MKERPQKSNLAHDENKTNSLDNDMTQNVIEYYEDSDKSPLPHFSSFANPLPSPASSTNAATSPASSTVASQDSSPYNKKPYKTCQQPTTAQVLQTYLASKKAKLEAPIDHIGAFFTAMEATTRRLPPILQIEAKAKISALISDLEMKAYLSNEQNTAIASPLQSTSFNNPVNITSITSPIKPVDFSNQQNRNLEDIFEINSVEHNYYTLENH